MVRPGSAYEDFVGEKFDRLYADAVVKVRDKLPGQISGIEREIDVLIKQSVDGIDLLYISSSAKTGRPAQISMF